MQQLHSLGGEEQRFGPGFERRTTLMLEHEAVQDLAEWRLSGRTVTTSWPCWRSAPARDATWVLLPAPSSPSNEMKNPRHALMPITTPPPSLTQTAYSEGRSMTS